MFSATIRSTLRSRLSVQTPRVLRTPVAIAKPLTSQIRSYSAHHEETFEEFTARYVNFHIRETD